MKTEHVSGVGNPPTTPPTTAAEDPSVRLRQMRRILDTIMTAWAKAPCLRLGQLLENALGRYSACPTFCIEDEEVVEALSRFEQEFLNKQWRPEGGGTADTPGSEPGAPKGA